MHNHLWDLIFTLLFCLFLFFFSFSFFGLILTFSHWMTPEIPRLYIRARFHTFWMVHFFPSWQTLTGKCNLLVANTCEALFTSSWFPPWSMTPTSSPDPLGCINTRRSAIIQFQYVHLPGYWGLLENACVAWRDPSPYLTRRVLRVNTVEAMVDGLTLTKDGQVDPNELAKWVRQATRMGLTGEDAAKLAAYK